jgi:hypothetical protein
MDGTDGGEVNGSPVRGEDMLESLYLSTFICCYLFFRLQVALNYCLLHVYMFIFFVWRYMFDLICIGVIASTRPNALLALDDGKPILVVLN